MVLIVPLSPAKKRAGPACYFSPVLPAMEIYYNRLEKRAACSILLFVMTVKKPIPIR